MVFLSTTDLVNVHPILLKREINTLSLQKVNVGTCTMDQTMKGQKDVLFGFGGRQGIGSNDIIYYWVDQVESGNSRLAGCASHPDSQPACVASALGSPWILANEIHLKVWDPRPDTITPAGPDEPRPTAYPLVRPRQQDAATVFHPQRLNHAIEFPILFSVK